MKKTALITGITGQDGSYLAELLLKKNYQVVGLISRKHSIGNDNIKAIKAQLILEAGDLLNKASLKKIILKHQPEEIYNLAAVSFIPASWDQPSLSFNINTLGLARILELVKDHLPKTRVFQASSAKIFGRPENSLVDEQTLISPRDPYAVSKAAAHFLIQAFRVKFGLFCCSAIMFNHESPRRGLNFLTRKIIHGAVQIKQGKQKILALGNLAAQADWGYAPEYTTAMWLMLQQNQAEDFVLATGKLHSVKQVCQAAFNCLDLDYQKFVTIDKRFYRKAEAAFAGNPAKAKQLLGWKPETDFKQLIKIMVKAEQER
ncbi:GDP-mannose 4,6-dehydratase [Patescibacteria group bacterium]|nr:GDP-mannose 4,6-dehydratase [Patescibacteria group bacterium]MBU1931237.1 GDP-mannose 4,6-dehydratase [Patescibacteria group bacterium]